ncbi:uncharacterized protein LOC113744035 isoform X2 [Larimichthys crocea]|uniref:uncharacterized protein LOC113744035 isoform X2 n=1 Tax=Larimichthys crocea TaxID=215358 RepID=UPI000F5EABBD|nr:uncharacterized protein LOC113744035 isoform X2 [Larimichthys crocea]XP_027135057.1 uncharacterized protein LOC113744035 isoform X2 [Larimichthys crocea]XP_027135058.1 uncharacterized protein LOC113744035 isoform X2 [Larimichthys crocea]
MRTLLLLLLSLMTGCVASKYIVKGCEGGWVEFTCRYQNNEYYPKIVVDIPKAAKDIQITQRDVWKQEGNISLYHDTTNKKLRVAIKQLQSKNVGDYECKFYLEENDREEQEETEVEVERDRDDCQKPFTQTVYRTAKTTITCNYPGKRVKSDVLFFCKENNFTCEDILSTESSPKSSETFTLTKTNTGFNVSISKVSSHHAGVYWCGVKSNEGRYRAGFTKIQLQVKTGDSRLTIIAVVVCVALLALLLFLVLLYKRREHTKNTRNEDAQNDNEEAAYAEIRERPQLPDSETAVKTIYTTANFPTNSSSASHDDPNTHTYSTVQDTSHQHPTYSTVNHPSGFSENPFYSTVNNPQHTEKS